MEVYHLVRRFLLGKEVTFGKEVFPLGKEVFFYKEVDSTSFFTLNFTECGNDFFLYPNQT